MDMAEVSEESILLKGPGGIAVRAHASCAEGIWFVPDSRP